MGLFGEEPAVVDVAVAIVGGSLATLGVAAAMSDWPAAQAPWNGLCVFFAIESALTVGLWALVR